MALDLQIGNHHEHNFIHSGLKENYVFRGGIFVCLVSLAVHKNLLVLVVGEDYL